MSQIITLPSGGSLPGIPGDYAPGTYQIDYTERTATRVDDPTALPETPPEKLPVPVETQHPAAQELSDTTEQTSKKDKKSE